VPQHADARVLDGPDDGAAAVADLHEPELSQGGHGFADGAAAHAQARGQLALGREPVAGLVVAPQDGIP